MPEICDDILLLPVGNYSLDVVYIRMFFNARYHYPKIVRVILSYYSALLSYHCTDIVRLVLIFCDKISLKSTLPDFLPEENQEMRFLFNGTY